MQQVSERWKELHTEDLLPENFIQVTYKVTETGVNDTYESSANELEPWSDISDMAEVNPTCPKYALLELNQWILDGSTVTLPDSNYKTGKFVSKYLCDENGYFETRPTLTLSWDTVHDVVIPGLTIQWSKTYEEYPVEYIVKIYNGDQLVSELVNADNDSAFNVFFADINNFDRVEVEIVRWNLPYHRARIEQFYMGVIRTYEKGDLMSFSCENFTDILSGELPKNTLTFSLDNTDGKWNPLNPEGEYKYLLAQQTITVRYGMNVDGAVEWVDGGTMWLSEWDTPSNGIEAVFTAENVLAFMDVLYTGTRKSTLLAIANAAIGQVDLPDDATYAFDDSLASVSVDFSADTADYTVAEILQMVANAGRCILTQDVGGCLRIEPASMVLSDYIISKFVSYTYPEIAISKELKAVNVNNGLFVVNNSAKGAVQTMDNPIITTAAIAESVGGWARDILNNRRTVDGEFRADTRLNAGDMVTVENQFSESGSKVFITSVKYDFNGAFKGTYEGRVIE